jgi:hypothetical protein
MTYYRHHLLWLAAATMATILSGATWAQDPGAFQNPPQPVFQQAPQQPTFADPNAIAGGRPSMRLLFAQSLAAAAQTMGTSLIVGLSQALTGSLTSWLERKAQRRNSQAGVAAQPAFAPPAPAPSPPAQFFDAQSGQPVVPDPVFSQQASAPPPAVAPAPDTAPPSAPAAGPLAGDVASTTLDLFAGLAFEVHALGPGEQTTPVNPATHEFRTGDQFVVFFRPTLPGRMEVYNVNAAGQQTQIDLQMIAAGQLAKLGPYQFTAMTGDEQLKLVIIPCTTPALAVATRDIVNVAGPAAPAAGGLDLSACQPAVRSINRIRTRDIRTRDIQKVAVEGQTGFALDPVTSQERATGNLAPREVSIVMRHR